VSAVLEGRGVTKAFGGRRAVDDVAFTLGEGEILGLIGPNGAGKTTLFNLISGAVPPDAGAITMLGRRISGLPPYAICRMLHPPRDFAAPVHSPWSTHLLDFAVWLSGGLAVRG
jgi:ABC-type branched-subunit amino acid transport system ATPase component